MSNKIFVELASYRDPQLTITIDDMLKKAKDPEQFTFGICWQHDETEDINRYDNDSRFRVSKHHYNESQGLGWARAITNTLYDGEALVLQLDSHHRFDYNWDQMMLEDFNQAKSLCEKPILTTYLTPFQPEQEKYDLAPCLMSQYEFSYDSLLMSRPYYIGDYKQRSKVIRGRTISGHFLLAESEFISDVPYDPDIYFGGYTEETTLSVRAFTHGYDFYSPYRQYIWHEYTRNNRPKHWEDHGTVSQTKKTSGERDIYARKKTRQLFGQEDHGIDMGIYGLGNKRTLHDYEVFGGFDFKKCRIQDYTLQVNEPPNPSDWENGFISHKYDINCEWDTEFFKKFNAQNPDFLTFSLHNNSGKELFRKDFNISDSPEYVKLINNRYLASFYSQDKPDKIVMYLFDKDKQWSERYEKQI